MKALQIRLTRLIAACERVSETTRPLTPHDRIDLRDAAAALKQFGRVATLLERLDP